jgi:hypothetical protein
MKPKNLKKLFRETGKAGAAKRWGSDRPASSTIRVHADVAADLRTHCEANNLDTVAEASRLIRSGLKS